MRKGHVPSAGELMRGRKFDELRHVHNRSSLSFYLPTTPIIDFRVYADDFTSKYQKIGTPSDELLGSKSCLYSFLSSKSFFLFFLSSRHCWLI